MKKHNKIIISTITISLFFSPVIFIFAQSDGTIPDSSGGSAIQPADTKTQAQDSAQPASDTIIPKPASDLAPVPRVEPVPSSQNSIEQEEVLVTDLKTNPIPKENNNSLLYLLSSLLGVLIASLIARLNNNKQDEKKCDSIKNMIDQKIRELEDQIKNWPEEKLKGLAKDQLLKQLKKNEVLGKTIEIAEDLKNKYNTSLKAIELLQKKYDLCMISLPKINKKHMQKITTHLWFDKEAKEAANFYVDVFAGNSKIKNISTIKDTPSGDTDIVSFDILGTSFMAISAGPLFKFNPSISFMVNFDPSKNEKASENIDIVWNKLLDGGKVLMPIQEYPFSKRYGWVEDKFGLSWQLILTNPGGEERPEIIPTLLFVGESYGKAEEFVNFYTSIFKESKIGNMMKYGPNQELNKEGTVMFSDFKLFDQWFAVMDGGGEHNFKFNEAISFIVNCKDQEEIDYYWEKLSAFPESEQCGWLKDKFGVSWQIVPEEMNKLMGSGDKDKMERVTKAFLRMKKFDIKKLKEAAEGA